MCEDIIDILNFNVPDTNKYGNAITTVRSNEQASAIIYERLLLLIPEIEKYYQIEHKGTEELMFEWMTEQCKNDPHCENSSYLRKKWLRTKVRDISGVLFMSDYQEQTPFEADYEVYGGKLEFPQHQFGFNPQRGTLIIYPSDPHFINVNSPIHAGELYQVRFHLAAKETFIYQPDKFPGNYTMWFNDQLK